jgi:SOS-response transcriptional repressor LexA
MAALANSRSFAELQESYRLCTTDQWDYYEAKEFAERGLWKQHVGQVAYRPFDRQWTVLHKHVLTILRKKVMSQFGGKDKNLGLISSRAVNDLSFAHCFVTDEPVDKIFISSKTSTNAYVFPLFIRNDDIFGMKRRPNFSRTFLTLLAGKLDATKATEHGLPAGLTPEDIFHYAYAVFHSPGYRSRYAEFLKIDFPRLPLTGNLELFRALARLGGDLTSLHLLVSPRLDPPITEFVGDRNPEVEKVSWSYDTVWVDKAQTIGFRGVPEAVWNFHIGGYQVCEKWLKDRKGRTLSNDDITYYQKIVVALSETIRLMAEIDEVIEAHGGWPGAFQTEARPAAEKGSAPPFRIVADPPEEERYVTCVPLVPLKVAAGTFSESQHVVDEEWDWAAVKAMHRLRPGMFVVQVEGRSMEPSIPDGSYCLFDSPVEGSRQGKTVLVKLHRGVDPESGANYTIKLYESEKVSDGDSWRHERITLKPNNPDFPPLVFTEAPEEEFAVIAEFLEVIALATAEQSTATVPRAEDQPAPRQHERHPHASAAQRSLLDAIDPTSGDSPATERVTEPPERDEWMCVIRQLFTTGGARDRETAIQQLKESLGYQRLGSRIREMLGNAIRTAVRRGILTNEANALSLRTRSIEDYDRDFLKNQFLASFEGRTWKEREEAIRGLARWLGFRRTGPTIDETARSLINGLIREDRLESSGSLIRRSS